MIFTPRVPPRPTSAPVQNHRRRLFAGRLFFCCAALLLLTIAFLPQQPAQAAAGASRQEGATLFAQKGCAHCHGADLSGTDSGPSLQTVGKHLHKNQIEHQIRFGGQEMPPFGDSLNDDEIKSFVKFLAHQKKAPKKAAVAKTASVSAKDSH